MHYIMAVLWALGGFVEFFRNPVSGIIVFAGAYCLWFGVRLGSGGSLGEPYHWTPWLVSVGVELVWLCLSIGVASLFRKKD
jgi:hypothetical protein